MGGDVDSAINNLVSAINSQQSGFATAERDGMKIKITTANKTSSANSAYISGANGEGGTFPVQETKYDGKKAGVSGVTSGGVTNLVKGQSSSGYTSSFRYNFDGTNITFTTISDGSNYNNYSIMDGYNYTEPKDVTYTAYTNFADAMETVQNGSDGDKVKFLSPYKGTQGNNYSVTFTEETLSPTARTLTTPTKII